MLVFLNLLLGVRECFPLLSGPPTLERNIFQIRSIIILYQIHFHFYIFFSKSARNKGKMNTTVTGSEVKHVRQVMDFRVFESALGS